MQQPTQTKKKPKPIVAIIAVLVPLLVLVVAATVSQRSSDEGSASATTLVQYGDPEASGNSGKDAGKGDGTTTSANENPADTKDDGAEGADDEPGESVDAGTEGELTTVTYPQPTVPAGGCSRPSGPVVITLGEGPDPACLELAADQPITVRNRTGEEISFVAISVNEIVSAGSELSIGTAGSAFGEGQSTFWSPGNPQLSGIVVVG